MDACNSNANHININYSTISNTISATNVEDNKTGRVSDDVRF